MEDRDIEHIISGIVLVFHEFGGTSSVMREFLDKGLKPYLKELQKYVNKEKEMEMEVVMQDHEIEMMINGMAAVAFECDNKDSMKRLLVEGFKPFLQRLQKYIEIDNAMDEMEKVVRNSTFELWQSYCQQKIDIADLKEALRDNTIKGRLDED